MKNKQVFTIGHSNHSPETFIALLDRHGISAVADVRSHPHSRHFPQYNREELEGTLFDSKRAYKNAYERQAEKIAYTRAET